VSDISLTALAAAGRGGSAAALSGAAARRSEIGGAASRWLPGKQQRVAAAPRRRPPRSVGDALWCDPRPTPPRPNSCGKPGLCRSAQRHPPPWESRRGPPVPRGARFAGPYGRDEMTPAAPPQPRERRCFSFLIIEAACRRRGWASSAAVRRALPRAMLAHPAGPSAGWTGGRLRTAPAGGAAAHPGAQRRRTA
jgi:hypothetical protein